MSDDAPKVLVRSEQSYGHVAIVELAGGGRPPAPPPPEALGPIPEVVSVGPPLGRDEADSGR